MNGRDPVRERELGELRAKLAESEKRLPAHSVRPHQLLAIEELEGRIRELERELGLAGGAQREGEST